jgi:hypothetical protein
MPLGTLNPRLQPAIDVGGCGPATLGDKDGQRHRSPRERERGVRVSPTFKAAPACVQDVSGPESQHVDAAAQIGDETVHPLPTTLARSLRPQQ